MINLINNKKTLNKNANTKKLNFSSNFEKIIKSYLNDDLRDYTIGDEGSAIIFSYNIKKLTNSIFDLNVNPDPIEKIDNMILDLNKKVTNCPVNYAFPNLEEEINLTISFLNEIKQEYVDLLKNNF